MAKDAVDPAPYEARLRKRLAELELRLDEIEHDLDQPPPADWEDRATERESDEVMEELGHAGVVEIHAIKAALKRVAQGEYGWCAKCGAAIDAQRLDIVPHAALCRNCAI